MTKSPPKNFPGLKLKYKKLSKLECFEPETDKNEKSQIAKTADNSICELEIPRLSDLPHVSPIYFDRVFQLLSIDDILTIFLAIMSEQKKVIIVSHNTADLVPVIWTLLGFMYPFEWSLPKVPVFFGDEGEDRLSGAVNSPLNTLYGMTNEAFEIAFKEIEELEETMIVDLRYAYCLEEDQKTIKTPKELSKFDVLGLKPITHGLSKVFKECKFCNS